MNNFRSIACQREIKQSLEVNHMTVIRRGETRKYIEDSQVIRGSYHEEY